jgi:hypothetical protein
LVLSIISGFPGVVADAVVDRDIDDNQNDLEYYRFYFDDFAPVGKYKRLKLVWWVNSGENHRVDTLDVAEVSLLGP